MNQKPIASTSFRKKLRHIIFNNDTPASKGFDIALIICIVLSVAVFMLETVSWVNDSPAYKSVLYIAEWCFTGLFTIEYLLRIYVSPNRRMYIFSFFGIIDLMSVLPTWCSIFFPGTSALAVIRVLRVLRIFKVLHLSSYMGDAEVLKRALYNSRRKIFIFFTVISTIVIIMGSLMYIIEGANNGFTSIPRSVYWAIVTLTTVGYGDISPMTPVGQFVSSILMILGYAIIAVPTGIITSEMTRGPSTVDTTKGANSCSRCKGTALPVEAIFCHHCGHCVRDCS
jgi:voltage-gated potassium channel